MADEKAHPGMALKIAASNRDAINGIVGSLFSIGVDVTAIKDRPVTASSDNGATSAQRELFSIVRALERESANSRRKLQDAVHTINSLNDENSEMKGMLQTVLTELRSMRSDSSANNVMFAERMTSVRDSINFNSDTLVHAVSTTKGLLQDSLDRLPKKRGAKGENTAEAKRRRMEELDEQAALEVASRREEWERQVREAREEETEEANQGTEAGSSVGFGHAFSGFGTRMTDDEEADVDWTASSARVIVEDNEGDDEGAHDGLAPPSSPSYQYAPTSPTYSPTSPTYSPTGH